MNKRKEPSWKVVYIAAGITVLILVGWLRSGELSLGLDGQRKTSTGELIQSNGLTQKQEVEIRIRCAEGPQSLACR